ncbi:MULTISPECIES: hypothetical protein [Intestinimonas]|nr:hypothetical protein [Intestinimonas butyriciproducens]MBS6523129.1 hypothetical protein [Clostridiales bacterium]MBU5230011.1 hypothetical protein [Intestinimonas butyriciproducens]MDB7862177.1 hypothetical protein [Intestinimonas butyriciproducens]
MERAACSIVDFMQDRSYHFENHIISSNCIRGANRYNHYSKSAEVYYVECGGSLENEGKQHPEALLADFCGVAAPDAGG